VLILLNEFPRVALSLNAVSADLTKAVIEVARPRLQGALVSEADGGREGPGRSAQVAWLSHDLCPMVETVVGAITAVAGLDRRRAERFHIIRYGVGGEYRPHFDGYDLSTERGRRCTASRGQRVRTALLYLNDGFVGGATCFPRLDLEIVPRQGAVLVFDNCDSDCALPHHQSLHAGAPLHQGEKWVGTLWFRERRGRS